MWRNMLFIYKDGHKVHIFTQKRWGVGSVAVRGQSKFVVTSVGWWLNMTPEVTWVAREV